MLSPMAPVHGFYPLSAIGKAKSWHVKDTNDLLSEKLLDGYSLLADTFCPHCVTPLVRRQAPTMIGSFKALPVASVALCVSCNEHVVANDYDTLVRCSTLKEKEETDTDTLDSILNSLQKCAQRRQNMIDAFEEFEEDRQDFVCTGAPDCPSDKRVKSCAREKAEEEKAASDTMESDAPLLLEVNASLKKTLSPTVQLDPSPSDAKRKDDPSLDNKADIEHDPSKRTQKIESSGETAARLVSPPTPVESDLLDPKQKEGLNYECKKILPHSSIKIPEKSNADSARRNTASQLMESKILQGYSFMEYQCLMCGMPLMKKADQIECVVCPVVAKKIIDDVKGKIFTEKKAVIKQKAAAHRKAEQEAVALVKAQEEQTNAKLRSEAAAKMKAEKDEAARRVTEEAPLRQPDSVEEIDTIDSKKPIDAPRLPSSAVTVSVYSETTHIMLSSPESGHAIKPTMPVDEPLVALPDEEEPKETVADNVEGIEATTHILPSSSETAPAIMPIPADEPLASLPIKQEPEVLLAGYVEGIELSLRQDIQEKAAEQQKAEAASKVEVEEDEAPERASETVSQPDGVEEISNIVFKKPIDATRSPSSVAAASACGETTDILPSSPETVPFITPLAADEPLVSLDITPADDMEGIELSLSQHIHKMKSLGETAARMAILPPRPVDCDLLGPMESEDEDENNFESDEVLQEYSIRREIASNLYGSKILQGYTLLDEAPCLKCGMPLVKNNAQVDCVVCPVLAKEWKEKEEEKKLAEQNAKVEAEAAAQKTAEGEAVMVAKVEEEKAELEAAKAIVQEEAAAKAKASDQEVAARAAAGEDRRRKETKKAAMRATSEEKAAKMIQSKMRVMLEAKTAEKYAAGLLEVEAFRMEEEARIAEEERLLKEALITKEGRVTKVASDSNRLSPDAICSFMSSLH